MEQKEFEDWENEGGWIMPELNPDQFPVEHKVTATGRMGTRITCSCGQRFNGVDAAEALKQYKDHT